MSKKDFEPKYMVHKDSGHVALIDDEDTANSKDWNLPTHPRENGKEWNTDDNVDVRKAQAQTNHANAEDRGKKSAEKAKVDAKAEKEADKNREDLPPPEPDMRVAIVPDPNAAD